MSELTSMLQALVTEAEAGRPSALCVVVQTRGSTPQKPGAAMLLLMAVITLLTGARTPQIPYKICPVIKTAVAVLYILGSVM